jgi:DtxR family Mn-dependent transcriptional regulator
LKRRRKRFLRGLSSIPYHGREKYTVRQQEVMQQIWHVGESQETVTPRDIKEKMEIPHLGYILRELENLGLITRLGGKISLTKKGQRESAKIIRKNRLAKVLFTQVFEMPPEEAAKVACSFEHIALSDDVTDAICTFLGHPPTSIDGRVIPPGECCERGRKELVPIIKKLTELKVGEEGRVVFIKPSTHSFLDRLSSLGVVPGTVIRLHQKRPTLVIQFSGTTMAIEDDVAKDIYVRSREEQYHEEEIA